MKNKIFQELYNTMDVILICDNLGNIMYYEDFDDNINMLKTENAIGKSIYDLYPFFSREDFTVFKAIDKKIPILNELQSFQVNGKRKKSINSAYPLISEGKVIGGIVLSLELGNKEKRKKKNSYAAKYDFPDIITNDNNFIEKLSELRKLAKSNSDILIYGETGTGKELIAHTIHANSLRCDEPFIIQNCAAIPSNLLESILFGTSKGSFTGAQDKAGIFEVADGGTLFLDEINSMSLQLQSKILRAIETKSFRRVGETSLRDSDIRILTSTNENLQEKVDKKEFRIDLFYRLNVVKFEIPPLRKRKTDIILLANHYIKYYNKSFNKKVDGMSDATIDILINYYWPGNVRELKNMIKYLITIKEKGIIKVDDLPKNITNEDNYNNTNNKNNFSIDNDLGLYEQIEKYEREIIKYYYEDSKYNATKTAEKLNISRQTLYNKLNKYEL